MMKYWNELNELESAIYDVKSIQAGLNILCQTEEFTCYSPSGITQEHQTFVLDLNERFDTAVEKLNERFQEVWNAVRDDTGRLGSAEEDEEFTNEDIAAIDELVKDHEASIRFEKILSNLPTMNTTMNTNNWSVSPLENGDFTVNYEPKGTWTIKEEDGNLTTSYRPATQQDLFDDQWNETYKRQSNR